MKAPGRGNQGRDPQGNTVGIDPHKRTLSATVLDERGGLLGTDHFKVSGDGHRALEQWALSIGPVAAWGVEGAGGIGRHTAAFLCLRGHDVRDVCPNRTNERARRRREGKSDALDSERIARETLAHRELPRAFKRAGADTGPDETGELLSLWHKERRSVVKLRQQLLSEADSLLSDLPDIVRDELPASKKVRTRLTAIARRDRARAHDPATALRLRLLDDHAEAISRLDAREREAAHALEQLI
ncbi:MAG TPA: transposase, partial [Actinomycetota bacterium]|nr:transposase [Actinomycetota bacterium]